ncbi:hypothetical protein [Pseudomonas sp. AU10]|uniref:hypothetical protein n=1 Tax=Pseudomonas sp. AU10 TaxID=882697 RepID=UPI0021E2265B|nr:hypothetical protein [Pseudomonas sp. AU10]MCV2231150.1 hypothetical protein [Pseudomonas sp. AU10]
MTDKPVERVPSSQFEEKAEKLPLTPAEIEVHLAIADFVIHQVNATAAGEMIFDALVKRFENRYPHHKLLSNCLLSPGYLVPDLDDMDDEAEISPKKLVAKLKEMLMHPEKSLEPAGPLAGPANSRSWIVDEE